MIAKLTLTGVQLGRLILWMEKPGNQVRGCEDKKIVTLKESKFEDSTSTHNVTLEIVERHTWSDGRNVWIWKMGRIFTDIENALDNPQ